MKLAITIFLAAAALGFVLVPGAGDQGPPGVAPRSFEGSWSAAGHRESLATEGGRAASTVYLSGAVVLSAADGLGTGFRGEVIGFDDGVRASIGRAVWTDQRGDRIFSTLTGETIGSGRRFAGTITGGTGRYAGVTGEYSFEWQYFVEAEQGAIQGHTINFKGRYRTGEVAK